jgi:hypothetical protein
MKRLIVLSLIMAGIVLMAGFSIPTRAQSPANDEKSTFYRLTPGVYVNGWPRFTIHYPKDWIEKHPPTQEIFRASSPGRISPESAEFLYAPAAPPTTPTMPSLDKFADVIASFFRTFATDVTIIYDKPSRLRDSTPAREFELRCLVNGAPFWGMNLVASKAGLYVNMAVNSQSGRIAEDLGKAILYSIEFEPDKDQPVKVPLDVQELLDRTCSAHVAHDIPRLMTCYSDKYLNSGRTKGERERFYRQFFGSITSFKIVITDFVPAGDRAYLTGFATTNFGPIPIIDTSIIKENGEWKWYGNQRDPPPEEGG